MATATKKKEEKSLLEKLLQKRTDNEEYYIVGHEAEDTMFSAPRHYYSTGIEVLDGALGNGGLGSGRISEVFGAERTAKSELLRLSARTFLRQHQEGLVFYYDQEQAVDQRKFFVDKVFSSAKDRFTFGFCPTAESLFNRIVEILEDIHALQAQDVPCFIGIDSLAALDTEDEQEKNVGDKTIAPLPRVLGPALRKIKPLIQKTNTHLMIINQIRSQIGKMIGDPDESPGGKALKFYCDYRIRTYGLGQYALTKSGEDEHGKKQKKEAPDGILIKYKTVKNKLAPPLRECEAPVLFGSFFGCPSGLSNLWSLFDLAKREKWIEVRGSKYFINDAIAPDMEESFEKEEWPLIYTRYKEKFLESVKGWSDRILLITEEEVSGDDFEDKLEEQVRGEREAAAAEKDAAGATAPAAA